MAAAPSDETWLDLQRRREERMRYEVLYMLYRASEGRVEKQQNAWYFALELGVWHTELFRVVEWLDRKGLLRYCGAGPVVCLTPAGVDLIERRAGQRRSIRDGDV